MSREQLYKFLLLLKASPSAAVFNPWWQIDDENDIGPNCPGIRREHLTVYFRERLDKARLAIVGEALGYRGGHFSGIPMTSERMLLGKKPDIIAALCKRRNLLECAKDGERRPPLQIIAGIKPRRTSKPPLARMVFRSRRQQSFGVRC
jgi:hypothetical protein